MAISASEWGRPLQAGSGRPRAPSKGGGVHFGRCSVDLSVNLSMISRSSTTSLAVWGITRQASRQGLQRCRRSVHQCIVSLQNRRPTVRLPTIGVTLPSIQGRVATPVRRKAVPTTMESLGITAGRRWFFANCGEPQDHPCSDYLSAHPSNLGHSPCSLRRTRSLRRSFNKQFLPVFPLPGRWPGSAHRSQPRPALRIRPIVTLLRQASCPRTLCLRPSGAAHQATTSSDYRRASRWSPSRSSQLVATFHSRSHSSHGCS
jgi:hypothetical protein